MLRTVSSVHGPRREEQPRQVTQWNGRVHDDVAAEAVGDETLAVGDLGEVVESALVGPRAVARGQGHLGVQVDAGDPDGRVVSGITAPATSR